MKKMFFSVALAATIVTTMCSCGSADEQSATHQEETQQARVTLSLATGVTAETRSALTANGKVLTDVYVLDYDATSGMLLQVMHQTAGADGMDDPQLTMSYGDHVVKVIATRSTAPALFDAQGKVVPVADNKSQAPAAGAEPVALTAAKTSDTFAAVQQVTISDRQQRIDMTLQRIVARLVVRCTDLFPADCSTISASFSEYRTLSLTDFLVIDAQENDRFFEVSNLAGTTGTTLSCFLLAPADGYRTDVTLTMQRQTGTPYATITVKDVLLEPNKVTTISGPLYHQQQGITISVNDTWSSDTNDYTI